MPQGGEIRRQDGKDIKVLRMGNPTEHFVAAHLVETNQIQVCVITVHGSGMLTFGLEDFVTFLQEFTNILAEDAPLTGRVK